MAIYTFQFRDKTNTVKATLPRELWAGNRDKSNRQAIAIAQTMFGYLKYRDDDCLSAMWLAVGNDGEEFIKSIQDDFDWDTAAITVDYLHNGRTKTACFTLNRELGQQIVPSEDWFVTEADRAFEMAWRTA